MKTILLLQDALAPLGGNYTAGQHPFKGAVVLPSADSAAAVELSLGQTAAQAWATELALLHASGMTAEAEAANRYSPPRCFSRHAPWMTFAAALSFHDVRDVGTQRLQN